MDGKATSAYDILQDAVLSKLLSDEGPIPNPRALIARTEAESTCGEFKSAKYTTGTAIPHVPL